MTGAKIISQQITLPDPAFQKIYLVQISPSHTGRQPRPLTLQVPFPITSSMFLVTTTSPLFRRRYRSLFFRGASTTRARFFPSPYHFEPAGSSFIASVFSTRRAALPLLSARWTASGRTPAPCTPPPTCRRAIRGTPARAADCLPSSCRTLPAPPAAARPTRSLSFNLELRSNTLSGCRTS